MTPLERFAARAAVFLGGAMLMALEVAAFRIIGKTFGSALRETTAVIAVFLTSMSLGYWAGGRAGDRWPRVSTLAATLLGAAATLLAVPWLDAIISPRVAASGLDLATHAFLATTVLFAIPAVLFAAISPIAVRLFATNTGESGSTAGSISAISTVGSIAGTILTAFFLLDWLASITRTVLTVSIGACVTAAALMAASLPRLQSESHPRVRRYGLGAAILAVVLVIPAAAFVRSSRLDQSLLAPTAGWKIVFVGDSPYHRVTVRDELGKFRYLSFNVGLQSKMTLSDPSGPGNPYTDSFHLGPLLRPGIRRVLMIGLGGGTSAKQFLQDYPQMTVDVVELDPLVVDVARRYFFLRDDPRLRIHITDGRTFLDRSSEKWDLIVIDAYTTNRYGDALPPHLTTREFFQRVAAHLSDGGIVHFHCAWGTSQLVPALHKTMGSVFDSVVVSRGEILASDVPLIVNEKAAIAERARTSKAARFPELPAYIAELDGELRVPAGVPLLTDDYAPVDRLVRLHR